MPQLSASLYTDAGSAKFCFAAYPSAKIYKAETGNAWSQHLLFGDYIKIIDTEVTGSRVRAKSRNTEGWISVDKVQKDRVLEVNFVDIGQGDGCHVVTPDDQHILIDAGRGENMLRYLVWRFNLYSRTPETQPPLPFSFKVVISHSDEDHYGGFEGIFRHPRMNVSEVYHNGIVQRPGEANEFGSVVDDMIVSLVSDTPQMLALINDPLKRKGTNSSYPKVLFSTLARSPNVVFRMLSKKDEFLPPFVNTNKINGQKFTVRVLGPITVEKNGTDCLPYIKDAGKTKNGHSVLLRVDYGKARILLGGDLNEEAGEKMVAHYKAAGKLSEFRVDAAKACHHGSNHFYYDFVRAVNAAATVISSGDDESYSHPRPDAIGSLGKCGYGDSPLVFSTEIARSNKDITRRNLKKLNIELTEVASERVALKQLEAVSPATPDLTAQITKLRASILKKNRSINSMLTKYGMINLRTDGRRMIIAQKLEVEAGYGKWDIHQLVYSETKKRFVRVEAD